MRSYFNIRNDFQDEEDRKVRNHQKKKREKVDKFTRLKNLSSKINRKKMYVEDDEYANVR